ncbi:hypothetical protein ACQPYE_13755 [Actinosynnema sp. CA-299493]
MFTRSQFKKAAQDVRALYRDADLDRTWDGKDAFSDAAVTVAWSVYDAVVRASDKSDFIGLIIGSLRITNQPPDLDGSGIDPDVKNNFWTMHEATKKFGPGGVLKSHNWSILVNDAWLLGGVHTRLKFFLASPRTTNNVYDTTRRRLRVFGRELAGLAYFDYGYVDHQWPQLGEVQAPTSKTWDPTFREYQTKGAAHYETGDRWKALLKDGS